MVIKKCKTVWCFGIAFGMAMVLVDFVLAETTSAKVVTPKTYFGLHIHAADRGTEWPKVKFGAWRLWDSGVQWPNLQPERRQWDFARLDRYVAISQLTKVSILLPLGLSPRWASARPGERSAYGEGKAAEPRDMDDWRSYIQTVAQRYKGKIYEYEIWNEPNSKDFFSGTTENLVQLTCEAYKVLKEIDAAVTVVSPAFTGEQNIDRLGDFLAKGGRLCIDVVAYHLYVPASPPEAIIPLINKIRAVMEGHEAGQLPLWNTESGWWMANEDGTPDNTGVPSYWTRLQGNQAAAYVARALILGRSMGVERFYWYAWDNRMLGLIEPNTKTYKISANAYGNVARWIIDTEAPKCSAKDSVWSCILGTTIDGTRVITWSEREGQSIYVSPVGQVVVSAERADGTNVAVDSSRKVLINTVPAMIQLKPRTAR